METTLVVFLVLIIFVSSFVRTAIGFGDSVIAMPILSVLFGLTTATPLIGITTLSLGVLILFKEKKSFSLSNITPLLIPTFVGIPIGIYCLTEEYESFFKAILGLILILFAAFNLLNFKMKYAKSPLFFGFLAGVFGGAYNTLGPPIVVYASTQNWDTKTFKASLQGYFIVTEVAIVAGHGLKGLWTPIVLNYLLLSIPALILGFVLGNLLFGKLDERKSKFCINVFLIFMGVFLVVCG